MTLYVRVSSEIQYYMMIDFISPCMAVVVKVKARAISPITRT